MSRIRVKNDPALDTNVEALRRTISAQKVELASRNLRITGLEERLRDMREHLIKVRDALGQGHELEAECNRHVARAWHLLNSTGVAAPIGSLSPAHGTKDNSDGNNNSDNSVLRRSDGSVPVVTADGTKA